MLLKNLIAWPLLSLKFHDVIQTRTASPSDPKTKSTIGCLLMFESLENSLCCWNERAFRI